MKAPCRNFFDLNDILGYPSKLENNSLGDLLSEMLEADDFCVRNDSERVSEFIDKFEFYLPNVQYKLGEEIEKHVVKSCTMYYISACAYYLRHSPERRQTVLERLLSFMIHNPDGLVAVEEDYSGFYDNLVCLFEFINDGFFVSYFYFKCKDEKLKKAIENKFENLSRSAREREASPIEQPKTESEIKYYKNVSFEGFGIGGGTYEENKTSHYKYKVKLPDLKSTEVVTLTYDSAKKKLENVDKKAEELKEMENIFNDVKERKISKEKAVEGLKKHVERLYKEVLKPLYKLADRFNVEVLNEELVDDTRKKDLNDLKEKVSEEMENVEKWYDTLKKLSN